jgi:hypothetical protein
MKAFRIVALAALSAPAFAQDGPAPSVAGDDEVVVQGRTPQEIRVEIERVENAVYERFNALNSTDEFDILCSEHAPTGSNIPVRTCQPNFVLRAQQRAAGASLQRMQGGTNGIAPNERVYLQKKGEELTAEMQRIAREDEELLRGLTRLAELNEIVAGEPPAPREPLSPPEIEPDTP